MTVFQFSLALILASAGWQSSQKEFVQCYCPLKPEVILSFLRFFLGWFGELLACWHGVCSFIASDGPGMSED